MTFSTPLATLLLVSTAIAVWALVTGVRALFAKGEWTASATLGFVLATLVSSVMDLLVTVSDSWVVTQDAFSELLYEFPPWAQRVQRAFYGLLLVAAPLLAFVRLLRPGARLNLPALLMLGVAGVSEASALLRGDNPFQPYRLIPLAVLVATVAAPRGLGLVAGLGSFCVVVACVSGVAGVVLAHFSVLPCGYGKCGIAGANLRGVFDNENALALYLALAMPFVWLAFDRRRGLVLSAYFLLLVVLTGSRSGLVAAAATFVVLVVVQPDLRTPRRAPRRAVALFSCLGVLLVVGVVLPFVVRDPRALTSRGYLWMVARQELTDPVSLLIGRGTLGWQHVREAGLIDAGAVYSVHNQWLNILFDSGLIGLLLALLAIAVHLVQAGRRYLMVVGCVLVPVFCLSITERPWGVDYADWLIWALPAFLLCYPDDGRDRRTYAEPSVRDGHAGTPLAELAAS